MKGWGRVAELLTPTHPGFYGPYNNLFRGYGPYYYKGLMLPLKEVDAPYPY